MEKKRPDSLKEVVKKASYFECWGINEKSSKNKFWRINRKFEIDELEHPEIIDQILNRVFTDKYTIYAYEFFGNDDNDRTISLGVFLARDIIYNMNCNCEVCKRHRELQIRLITSGVTKETYDFFEELWTDYCTADEDSGWYKAELKEEIEESKKLINEKDAKIKKLIEENDYLRDYFRVPMNDKCIKNTVAEENDRLKDQFYMPMNDKCIKNTVAEECKNPQLVCPKCGNMHMFRTDMKGISTYIQDQDSFEDISNFEINTTGHITCKCCNYDGKYSEFIENSNKKETTND